MQHTNIARINTGTQRKDLFAVFILDLYKLCIGLPFLSYLIYKIFILLVFFIYKWGYLLLYRHFSKQKIQYNANVIDKYSIVVD